MSDGCIERTQRAPRRAQIFRGKASKAGNDMIELLVAVRAADGSEREFRDWLVGSDRGALKLRHAAEAVGALAKYEAGEIGQDDFPGHNVRVKVIIEKRRGYPDQNRIEDYAREGG